MKPEIHVERLLIALMRMRRTSGSVRVFIAIRRDGVDPDCPARTHDGISDVGVRAVARRFYTLFRAEAHTDKRDYETDGDREPLSSGATT
jgi:hypothetical protein